MTTPPTLPICEPLFQTPPLTAPVLKSDLMELHNIAKARDDGTTVETLLAAIVHEGVRRLREVEA